MPVFASQNGHVVGSVTVTIVKINRGTQATGRYRIVLPPGWYDLSLGTPNDNPADRVQIRSTAATSDDLTFLC